MMRYLGVAVCLLAAWNAAGGEFVLAKDGKFVARLVVDPALETETVSDLSRALETIVGSAPVVSGSVEDAPALVVGAKGFEPFASKHAELPEGAFRIEQDGNRLDVVGGSPQGATFGVYALLNDLGCRWFMPGDIGEDIPTDPNLVWRGENRTESADFEFRQIWWAYGGPAETQPEFAKWLRRNKVAFPGISHGHNLTNTVPPATYLKDHPEYYALVDGTRQPTQLCTTHPDVIRLSIERINAYFDENPSKVSYSLCPDDNTDFCECDNCRALDAGGWSEEFKGPVVTDRLMVYLNAVAQGIQERHPGKMVTTYAYLNYSTPPVRETIDPHVSIVFTTSVYCAAHGIGDEACASRQTMKRDLEGWRKACQHVYIYEYDPIPYNAELPWPFFGAHLRAMPVYKAMGIGGFTFEAHNSWATLFPNFYVSARLMWDAKQDPIALLDDICGKFFGPAGVPMRRYYDEMDRAIAWFDPEVRWNDDVYPRIFTCEVLARCREYLGEAERLATDEKVRPRVEMVRMGFDYLDAYLASYRAAVEGKPYEEYKAKYDASSAQIDRMYAISKDYVLAAVAHDYLKRQLGPLEIKYYGDRLGLLTKWMVVGPFDNATRQGHAEAYPPERAVDFAATMAGKDGREVRWFEHTRDRGVIDLAACLPPGGAATAYALCYVESPEERPAQLRLGSNDSVKVWLGGKLVWDNLASRRVVLDQDIVPVTIPKGVTPLLVKVSNEGGAWGFCLRITDDAGEPVPGLTFRLR